MRILHITVHLGGGAGKAVAGIVLSANSEITNTVLLLEEPKDQVYIRQLYDNNIRVMITSDPKDIANEIGVHDITVVNWWGHPLMIRTLMDLPIVASRMVVWCHINGCSYPYLNPVFLNVFDWSFFTSEYSLSNPFWSGEESERILSKSSVVYGMGNFEPISIKQKLYSLSDSMVIGYSGTINYAKMSPFILDYFEKAITKYKDVSIMMLGRVSDEVKDEILKRGLDSYFILPGYVDNVFDYYRIMDVFAYLLNPNCYATTENSLIEAMAVGLPIVVMDNEVEKCIIKNEINGVRIHNIDEFIEFLEQMKNPVEAERLGNKARQYCLNTYSAKDNSKCLYECCYEIRKREKSDKQFISVLGKDGFDAFKLQAYADWEILESMLRADEGSNPSSLKRHLPHIYYEKDKASINQFLRYFPSDKKLKSLERIINYAS